MNKYVIGYQFDYTTLDPVPLNPGDPLSRTQSYDPGIIREVYPKFIEIRDSNLDAAIQFADKLAKDLHEYSNHYFPSKSIRLNSSGEYMNYLQMDWPAIRYREIVHATFSKSMFGDITLYDRVHVPLSNDPKLTIPLHQIRLFPAGLTVSTAAGDLCYITRL